MWWSSFYFYIVINDKKVPWSQHFSVTLETKKELSCVYNSYTGITFGFLVKVMSWIKDESWTQYILTPVPPFFALAVMCSRFKVQLRGREKCWLFMFKALALIESYIMCILATKHSSTFIYYSFIKLLIKYMTPPNV